MYKRLRKRFGVVLFALTALVVGIMAVLLAVLSCNKDAEQFRTDLRDSASEISQTIKTSKRINDVWLFEREANKEEIIFIHENGRPFYYRNNAGNEIRDQLITQAIQKACENGIDIEHNIYDRNDMTAEYEIDVSKRDIYCCVTELINVDGSRIAVTVLKSKSILFRSMAKMAGEYAAVMIAAWIVLFVISVWLSKLMIKPLEESDRKQKEFIAAISHELKTPVAVIKAAVTSAQMTGDHTQVIPIVEEESGRMGILVSDLMSLVRSDTGKWTIKAAEVDLEKMILQCYEKYTPILMKNDRAFKLKMPDIRLPKIESDENRITEILGILINNANDYSVAGGSVTLSAEMVRQKIRLCVEDEGPGITDEEKNKIFDRFYRGDKSRSDKNHFGLGLSIASEYAKLLGARLTVEDSDLGGACFTLLLPK